MSSYPTSSQLAAFRRAIPCAADHADRWFDCPFSRTHVSDHEREHGIGYVITHGSGADVDLAPIWSSDWRRMAAAMRSRAYDATYSGCDDCGGICDA